MTEESDEVSESSADGQTDPFLDGGAEPPVKKSAVAFAAGQPDSSPEFPAVQQEKNPAMKNVDSGDLAKVRNAIISDFSIEDAMIANSLSETNGWTLNGNTITVAASTRFVQVQLQSVTDKISAYLSQVYGRTIAFEVKVFEKQAEEEKIVLPKEVEILCEVFKGSLLGAQ